MNATLSTDLTAMAATGIEACEPSWPTLRTIYQHHGYFHAPAGNCRLEFLRLDHANITARLSLIASGTLTNICYGGIRNKTR